MSQEDRLIRNIHRGAHLDILLRDVLQTMSTDRLGHATRPIQPARVAKMAAEHYLKPENAGRSLRDVLAAIRIEQPAVDVTVVLTEDLPIVAAVAFMHRQKADVAMVATATGFECVASDRVRSISDGLEQAFEDAVTRTLEGTDLFAAGPDARLRLSARRALHDVRTRLVNAAYCWRCLEQPYHRFSSFKIYESCLYIEQHPGRVDVGVEGGPCG